MTCSIMGFLMLSRLTVEILQINSFLACFPRRPYKDSMSQLVQKAFPTRGSVAESQKYKPIPRAVAILSFRPLSYTGGVQGVSTGLIAQ